MGAPKPVGANCNLFYLRGRHLRLHELADPDKVPYNLAWSRARTRARPTSRSR